MNPIVAKGMLARTTEPAATFASHNLQIQALHVLLMRIVVVLFVSVLVSKGIVPSVATWIIPVLQASPAVCSIRSAIISVSASLTVPKTVSVVLILCVLTAMQTTTASASSKSLVGLVGLLIPVPRSPIVREDWTASVLKKIWVSSLVVTARSFVKKTANVRRAATAVLLVAFLRTTPTSASV